jgi:hypothetical protein
MCFGRDFLAHPGDPVMGGALRTRSAAELLALVTGADANGGAVLVGQPEDDALSRALPRWRDRLGEVPSVGRLAAWEQSGLRLVIPGDAEWPTQLDDLGDARPLVLWVRGTADLRFACLNSVAMVGSRATSGYGDHVALEMAATLAEHSVSVVSGGPKATNSQLMRTMVLAASPWQIRLTSLTRRPTLVGTCSSAGNHRAPPLAHPLTSVFRAVRLPAGADATSPASYTTDESPAPAPAPVPPPARSRGRAGRDVVARRRRPAWRPALSPGLAVQSHQPVLPVGGMLCSRWLHQRFLGQRGAGGGT